MKRFFSFQLKMCEHMPGYFTSRSLKMEACCYCKDTITRRVVHRRRNKFAASDSLTWQ